MQSSAWRGVPNRTSPRRPRREPGYSRSAMKIGCVSWCFHSFAGGTNPEEAIDTIGELGFDGTDLIVLAPEDLTGYWHAATLDRLKAQLERHQLEVAQFVLFQPVVEGLTSADASER